MGTDAAPPPVGAYVHCRREGDLLFLAGVGPRMPDGSGVAGGATRDGQGEEQDYDVVAQTEQVVANVRAILAAAGSSLERVVDVTVFLTDMQRDFADFNATWARHFDGLGVTRTTVEVGALPTPIAVEFKVVARA
ncbi:MAG: 2-aminomuconate deaminase [Marine Group III euryarchaeote CG-Bathy2]|uniref:Endoribonuclease l-psp (AmnD) n=3 Tax=Methanobacteriati TaxID=3366610 RepID=A0A075HMC6_9EURY|nr:endoribonuclease l-psp (amnD) [uncultured marine group II/III euryarchaeote KM3_59_B11]AIF17009.1 endoribonuclease l-psp (amnD) [uncultured marine group II/III euryarchaeote KM3_75_F08]OIR10576.1 MAG: 2-aminomuconate deaminase [Marine Group III euryarchaeote CG-Bathy2]